MGLPSRPLDLDERFRRPLMSFFMRRIGNRAEAEDLTQHVFLRILAAQGPEDIHNPEGFVFRVATNLLRDRSRARGRRGEGCNVETLSPGEMDEADLVDFSAERILLGRERLAEVMDMLSELDPRTGDIFCLFRLDKMKQREIAERYGIGLSTVEKHVMKATRQLGSRRAT